LIDPRFSGKKRIPIFFKKSDRDKNACPQAWLPSQSTLVQVCTRG